MKKTIAKLALALGALVITLGLAGAQPHHGHKRGHHGNKNPEEMADMMTVKMKYALSLDQAQEAKVKAINQKYAAKTKAHMDANKAIFEEFNKGIENIENEKEKELALVLKPEQLSKFQSKKEEMKKRHQHKNDD